MGHLRAPPSGGELEHRPVQRVDVYRESKRHLLRGHPDMLYRVCDPLDEAILLAHARFRGIPTFEAKFRNGLF